jgi:predicted MFS family arabinose efflux permease
VVSAALSGVDTGVMYLSCDQDREQKVFAVYNALGQVGLLLAAVVNGLWFPEDYRLAALCTVFSYGIAAVLVLGLKEVRTGETQPKRWGVGDVASHLTQTPGLLLLVLSVAMFNETHQTITVFLGQLKYVQVGMSPTAISLAFLIMTVIGLGSGWSAWLTERTGERRFGRLLFLSVGGGCVLLAWTKSPVLAVAGITLLRLCHGLMQPLQNTLQNRLVQTEDRASALSVNAMVMDVTAIFTNLIFGKIADRNLTAALLFGAALSLTGCVLYERSWGRCHNKQ